MCYIKILEIFVTHFILYIFKTICNFKIKLSINKNFGITCTVLLSWDMLLGTWNVRSLYRAGSLIAAARELARY